MTQKTVKRVVVIAAMGGKPYAGGIQTVVDNFINSELKNAYEFSIFDTYRKPNQVRKNTERMLYAMHLFLSCFRYLRKTRPSIVHIHFCSFMDFWKHSICLFSAKLLGIKTVFHLHGGSFDEFYVSKNSFTKFVIRRIFGLSDLVIALSSFWVEFLSTLVDENRIRVIHNPVDLNIYSPANGERVKKDRMAILLMGSLGKRKGHFDSLEAMRLVHKVYPKAKMLFAGGDEDLDATEKLKALAIDYGLEDNIEFLGTVHGELKISLIQNSGIKILPSYGENMPMAILEAMCARTPVISTRVGAIPEMLGEGDAGILIEPGDIDALSSGLQKLLSDPDYADTVAENGFKIVEERWSAKKVVPTLSKLYSDILRI